MNQWNPERRECNIELSRYFVESFGNSIRIDYGTGHELSFFAFMCCCEMMKILPLDSLVLVLFPAYMALIFRLQDKYKLEPAGSHGVWGLDDFHFLPYLLGSSQMQSCEMASEFIRKH